MNRAVRITSLALVGLGVALLLVNILSRGSVNVALPLLFLVLGGAFLILVFSLQGRLSWSRLLFIPAAVLIALGVILFLNALTGDRRSWIYAWLLILAAIGIGLLLALPPGRGRRILEVSGWVLTLVGVTGFIVIGVLVGGPFILWLAPLVLVFAGLLMRWLHVERILPAGWFSGSRRPSASAKGSGLVEPLSDRELEVMRLIGQGRTNAQIARELSVAESTVKTHINNSYGKLGVQTRVQALQRCRELGLLE